MAKKSGESKAWSSEMFGELHCRGQKGGESVCVWGERERGGSGER